ncbi:carboxylate-amine ligase [Embleya scabrispora]|uniref:carboxylate-amine ligase n=1 Tax=Embleya scabrispora TaxID=159449 RepID=UPI001374F83F|nr:glutamate-cysteine ligase family protein [Embleya scabrispora]
MLKLGIEEEFHVVDLTTKQVVPSARGLLDRLPIGAFVGDRDTASTIRLVGSAHHELGDLRGELVALRGILVQRAAGLHLGALASGTAPLPGRDEPAAAEPTGGRLTCGMFVRVEAEDDEVAARAIAWIMPHVPTLLALSSSSPYWAGRDTGHASWRRHRLDASAPAQAVGGAGASPRKAFHPPLRLSPHAPMLELRVCDAIADVEATVAIAALFRALYRHASRAVVAHRTPPAGSPTIARQAMRHAARSGLAHDLIDPVAAVTRPAATVVRALVAEMAPYLRETDDLDRVETAIERVLTEGTGAARQRGAARAGGPSAAVDRELARTMACVAVTDTAPAPTARLTAHG